MGEMVKGAVLFPGTDRILQRPLVSVHPSQFISFVSNARLLKISIHSPQRVSVRSNVKYLQASFMLE